MTYSPNRRLTRLKTLSFSGSYGWSLLGISRMVGKAAVYVSIRCRILSASYSRVSGGPGAWYLYVLTCWLINTMPISLRSVNRSNADSIAALSVFPSTTRKFFCESGAGVTCFITSMSVHLFSQQLRRDHSRRYQRGGGQSRNPGRHCQHGARLLRQETQGGVGYLIANDSKELSVLVVCL